MKPQHQQVGDAPGTTTNMIPADNEQASNIFCCAALANATHGTLYTDMAHAFPEQSSEGMQAFCSI